MSTTKKKARQREASTKIDHSPAKSEPTEAEHELLRKEIVDWYISAKAMIDHLYQQTCSMKHELKKNPDSPLAIWLNADEVAALSSLLEEASCKIADIPPPLPFPIADPMDVVLSIRATSKEGNQS